MTALYHIKRSWIETITSNIVVCDWITSK